MMVLSQIHTKAKPLLATGLNLLFPPRCAHCSGFIAIDGALCADCWQQVTFLADPLCERCGHPFPYEMGPDARCGECLREEPLYTQARTVCRYDETTSRLVTALKYAGRTQLVKTYGEWMARAGAPLIAMADVVAPVPLHRWRLLWRRYNQSALLAYAVAKHAELPVWPDLLRRIRHTPPQAGLTREQRRKNVRGVFRLTSRYKETVRHKKVLLIDDVMTTASTLQACSRALLRAGAANVYVLTLARTIRND